MKKLFVLILAFAMLVSVTAGSVLAGGDQVTGDKAAGPAVQNGECPFTGTDY